VLEGAFALLDALEAAGEARLAELAAASGLPKSSAHRLLEQMVALGAVERSLDTYQMGARMFRLGQGWQPHPGLLAAANRTVRWLGRTTGATVAVCVLREGRTLAVAGVQGDVADLVTLRPGVRWPATTAAGKALMAWDSPGPPPEQMPASWWRTARQIRERGVAVDREELIPGVCCVAVPLHGPRGEPVASLAAMVPAGRDLGAVTAEVTRAARAIDRGMRRTPGSAVVAVPRLHGQPGPTALPHPESGSPSAQRAR
jgi:DNA-binding IclR family transcriptional regulator